MIGKGQFFTQHTGRSDPVPSEVSGVAIRVNPASHTADVLLDNSQLLQDVPIANVSGPAFGTDVVWLHNYRGAKVALKYIENQYYITSMVPSASIRRDADIVHESHPTSVGGSDKTTYARGVYHDFSQGRAVGYLPGDKVIRSGGTTELGVLRAGLAWLKASPLCQIVLMKLKEVVRIVARTVQIYTDFGEVVIGRVGDGSKVGVVINGGATDAEAGPTSAHWTVKCELGASESGDTQRMTIRVNDFGNSQFVMLSLGADGTFKQTISKDREITVHNDDKLVILGNCNEAVTGTKTTTATGTLTIHSSTEVNIKAPSINLN